MAARRAAFSSSVSLGILRAAIYPLKELASSSMAARSFWAKALALAVVSAISSWTDSYPFFPMVRLPTMAARAAPKAPDRAAMRWLGAGASEAVSSNRARTFISCISIAIPQKLFSSTCFREKFSTCR